MTLASVAETLRLAVAGFADLPPSVLYGLAGQVDQSTFAAGQVLVHEGDVGNLLYVIADGQVEVTIAAQSGPLIMATLGPGESFGEIALLSHEHRRTATITALSPLRCYTLSAAQIESILARHPSARAHLEAAATLSTMASLLKRTMPFASLDTTKIRAVAARLTTHTVPAGDVIVQQGTMGDSCYILRQGRADVVLASGQVLATLEAGELFGEAALLTTAPRNATVRATEPCTCLEVRRNDLLEVIGKDRAARERMIELLRLRGHPKRRDVILVQQQQCADGTPLVILKDPQYHRYYRLSSHGWFLWQHLDGTNNLRDLALAFWGAFHLFAPHLVAEIIGGLSAAGFLDDAPLQHDVAAMVAHRPWWSRMRRHLYRVLHWHMMFSGIDPWIARCYQLGVRWCFTRPMQWLSAGITLVGTALFVHATLAHTALLTTHAAHIGWWIVMFGWIILIHEAGHAFTVKAYGRTVYGIGCGLHWGIPMVFVDTSDMWIAPRGPRIAVSLAGPYVNILTGSLAALTGVFAGPAVQLWGWRFAALSYAIALINCLPLRGLDGYHALFDR